jgi:hypothetical protein
VWETSGSSDHPTRHAVTGNVTGVRDELGRGSADLRDPGGPDSNVEHTAAEPAELTGVPAPYFSRACRELETAGYLEHTPTMGQVKFFRPGEAATARQVVVPLLSRTAG